MPKLAFLLIAVLSPCPAWPAPLKSGEPESVGMSRARLDRAARLLVERGMVALEDPVSFYLPEFRGGQRDKVRVLDLLSHTSGLPDMLPENTELRRQHA